jgi:hypothetical protein
VAEQAVTPDTLTFARQKPFGPFSETDVSVGPLDVPAFKGPDAPTVVGALSSGSGSIASVQVGPGGVSIGAVEQPGTYTGKVTLAPSSEDATPTSITLKVRDNWFWPAAALVFGLLIALASELWLTRARPEIELGDSIKRLKDRVAATTKRLEESFRDSVPDLPHTCWRQPRIESLLDEVTDRVAQNYDRALSSSERDRFGPGGKEMEKVETLIATYEELLGYASLVALYFSQLESQVDDELKDVLKQGALAQRVQTLLNGRDIESEAELAALDAEAKDLMAVIQDIMRLDEAFASLLRTSPQKVVAKLKPTRQDMLRTASTMGDATAVRSLLRELIKPSDGEEKEEKTARTELDYSATDTQLLLLVASAAVSPEFQKAPLIQAAAGDKPSSRRRYLPLEDFLFALMSGLLVFTSGMATLYFSNETFGSTANYLGMIVWGGTVSAGITLARRLIPGAVKTLSGS